MSSRLADNQPPRRPDWFIQGGVAFVLGPDGRVAGFDTSAAPGEWVDCGGRPVKADAGVVTGGRAAVAAGVVGFGLPAARAVFADAGHKDDLDPDGKWITIGHHPVHVDAGGTPDAGVGPVVRTLLEHAKLPKASAESAGDSAPSPADPSNRPEPVRLQAVKVADLPPALLKHAEEWKSSLGAAERDGLRQYTSQFYKTINAAARKCPEALDCLRGAARRTMEAVQSAVKKSGSFSEPVTAYRGLEAPPDVQEKVLSAVRAAMAGGHEYRPPGVQSLSADPASAAHFASRSAGGGGLMFQVKCTGGAPVGLTAGLSEWGTSEAEIVHNHATGYRVAGIDEGVEFTHPGGKTTRHTVVRLEQVDDGHTKAPPRPTGVVGRIRDRIGFAAGVTTPGGPLGTHDPDPPRGRDYWNTLVVFDGRPATRLALFRRLDGVPGMTVAAARSVLDAAPPVA